MSSDRRYSPFHALVSLDEFNVLSVGFGLSFMNHMQKSDPCV